MLTVDVTINLDKFQIVRENEGSQDEPFIWVFGIQFDGETASGIVSSPQNARLEFHTPPGRHKNLGPAAEHADNLKPFDIPEVQGVWKTSLRFDIKDNFPQFAPFCTLAVSVVGLEEDSTSNILAIEAHRRVVEFVKQTLTAQLRSILVDAVTAFGHGDPLPSGQDVEDRLTEVLNYRAIRGVINDFRDSQIPTAIVKGVVNLFTLPGNLAQLDHDEYVGDAQAVYTMPELIANAIDGHKIEFELNRDVSFAEFVRSRTDIPLSSPLLEGIPAINMPAKTGHYRVTGRTRRTDLREPPTVAATWSPEQIVLLARGDDRHCFFLNSDNGGQSFRAKGWRIAGKGVFISGMGAATSPDGSLLFVCGRGADQRMWCTLPGSTLPALKDANWKPIGQTTARLCCRRRSPRALVVVERSWRDLGFALGLRRHGPARRHTRRSGLGGREADQCVRPRPGPQYLARLYDGWRHPLGALVVAFRAAGHGVYERARVRGLRRRQAHFSCREGRRQIFFLRSENAGKSKSWHNGDGVPAKTWAGFKLPASGGFFISAPAVCASPDLNEIHLFGVFSDMRMYHRAIVNGKGSDWKVLGSEIFA
jgi:hypothetical protein